MLVLNGYFDGNTVRTFEPIVAQKNQKVTLTVLDDFVTTDDDFLQSVSNLKKEYSDIFGDKDEAASLDAEIEKINNIRKEKIVVRQNDSGVFE